MELSHEHGLFTSEQPVFPDVRVEEVGEHEERLREDEIGRFALVVRASDGVCRLGAGHATDVAGEFIIV